MIRITLVMVVVISAMTNTTYNNNRHANDNNDNNNKNNNDSPRLLEFSRALSPTRLKRCSSPQAAQAWGGGSFP